MGENTEPNELIKQPVIYRIDDNEGALQAFEKEMEKSEDKEVIFEYPIVYIHVWKKNGKYEVYIGESFDIVQRTMAHLQEAARSEDWHKMLLEKNVQLYIIGHEHFHKSMTMDVENRLMLFLSSVGRVAKVHNKRKNLQKSIICLRSLIQFIKRYGSSWGVGTENCFLRKNVLQMLPYSVLPLFINGLNRKSR